jgi:hypothetical protein
MAGKTFFFLLIPRRASVQFSRPLGRFFSRLLFVSLLWSPASWVSESDKEIRLEESEGRRKWSNRKSYLSGSASGLQAHIRTRNYQLDNGLALALAWLLMVLMYLAEAHVTCFIMRSSTLQVFFLFSRLDLLPATSIVIENRKSNQRAGAGRGNRCAK